MELVTPVFRDVAWLPVAAFLFLLPGWCLARRLPTGVPLLTSFLGSAVILFELVLSMNALGVPLHAGTVGIGLAGITGTLFWRKQPELGSPTAVHAPLPSGSKDGRWLWTLPPAVALISITIRSCLDPLSGYDNGTRWDYLARLFLAHESMMGYPPVTEADFEFYSWCDGIPPLVPLLNFWIYAVTGSTAPALSAVRVIGEALLLGHVVYRFSQLLWGKGAGWPAVAALSSSSLAIWSVAMGQETGLTALSLVSLLYFLELHARAPDKRLVFWAAIAAAAGALTREYGLSFILLGTGLLIARKQAPRTVFLFAVISIGLAAPWYARNWIITGDPLYPQTLGGIFPGNPVHNETMRTVAETWRLRGDLVTLKFFSSILLTLTGPLIALGIFVAVRLRCPHKPVWAGIALIALLWLWSVPQTAGGWSYSLRVLGPALALCATLCGAITLLTGRYQRVLLLGILLCTVDAARRSWCLPNMAFISPWNYSFSEWRDIYKSSRLIGGNPVWSILVRTASGGGIVVDHTANHALITMRGGKAIPLFSPLLAPTFRSNARFDDELARLRAAGVRFITFSQKNPLSASEAGHPFWSELYLDHFAIAEVNGLIIYDLDYLKVVPRTEANAP
jgi:hypothetical protein